MDTVTATRLSRMGQVGNLNEEFRRNMVYGLLEAGDPEGAGQGKRLGCCECVKGAALAMDVNGILPVRMEAADA